MQADCSLTTGFSGPKSSRDFRETGPWRGFEPLPLRYPCSVLPSSKCVIPAVFFSVTSVIVARKARIFQVFLSITEAVLKKQKNCENPTLQTLFQSAVQIHFSCINIIHIKSYQLSYQTNWAPTFMYVVYVQKRQDKEVYWGGNKMTKM